MKGHARPRRSAALVAVALLAASCTNGSDGPNGEGAQGGGAQAVGAPEVQIGDEVVEVAADGARVVIERDPFRIAVYGDGDEPALQQVAADDGEPLETPDTTDPIDPGIENPDTPTRYAPLSFLVGTESLEQHETGVWQANLKQGTRSGTQYAAQAVTEAEQIDGGVRLVLSTDDPTGRELVLEVRSFDCCAVRVQARAEPADGVAMMSDSFAATADEAFFGFGGRHLDLDQRGKVIANWVSKQNTSLAGWSDPAMAEELGATLHPNGPNAAFYPQSQFVSSEGYGFLVDQSELTRFKLAADGPDRWNVAVSAPELAYVVAPGSVRSSMGTLTEITGRHPVPPDWALGPVMDRIRVGAMTPEDYAQTVRDDLANFERYGLPVTGYRIEAWESLTPEVVAELIDEARSDGIAPMAYVTPWDAAEREGRGPGEVAERADGTPYTFRGSDPNLITIKDFTNPAVVAAWEERIHSILDQGFDGFMQDFGEEVMVDMRFHDGSTGAEMHNRYPVLYHEATRKAFDSYLEEHPERELWFYTRSGFSGRPGSAAFEGGTFPGDETTDWTRGSGIASLTPDMLNRAIGGAYGFTTDIGGYAVTPPGTDQELFLRWAQWAVFSPVFRLHGAAPVGTHMPWTFGDDTVEQYRELAELRVRAVPLIRQLWQEAVETGVPPTRPMWLDAPDDERARAADQQWMLGDDLLVAPVVERGATSRELFVPEGCWRQAGSDRELEGPAVATVEAALDTLPYFTRCGTNPLDTKDAE